MRAKSKLAIGCFDAEDRAEVELQGKDFLLLRERDLHAIAATRVRDGHTGLYL